LKRTTFSLLGGCAGAVFPNFLFGILKILSEPSTYHTFEFFRNNILALFSGLVGLIFFDWVYLSLVSGRDKERYGPLIESLRRLVPHNPGPPYDVGSLDGLQSKVAVFERSLNRESLVYRQVYEVLIRIGMQDLNYIHNASRKGVTVNEYHDQMRIASLLCGMGRQRMWATSTDPVVVFHRENASYYRQLERTSTEYRGSTYRTEPTEVPPPLCRIFICSGDAFFYSITHYAEDFLEMYRKHIAWSESKLKEPVLFFSKDIYKLFSEAGLDPRFAIDDFMVVDSFFVYGRRGRFSKENVSLRLIEDEYQIEKYAEVFRKMYAQSEGIEDILKKLGKRAHTAEERNKYGDLMRLCGHIRAKAGIRDDYTTVFSASKRNGEQFYHAFCDILSESTQYSVAVDVADQKLTKFWVAWKQMEAYQGFFAASRRSCEKGGKPFRLFVLDAPIDVSDKSEIESFVREMLEAGLNIGFIFKDHITDVNSFHERTFDLHFALDFVITNIRMHFDSNSCNLEFDNTAGFVHANPGAIGFELFGKEPFITEMLDWERNLIAKSSLTEKLSDFVALWNSNFTIKQAAPARSASSPGGTADDLDSRVKRLVDSLVQKETANAPSSA
jgi:hypothetical protein